MNNSQTMTIEQLGEKCIQHLEMEHSNLQSFVEICNDIQNTLGTGSSQKNHELVERQTSIDAQITQTAENREQLRREIAEQLGIPESSATIRLVQESLPQQQAEKITEYREAIETRIETIRSLTNTNNLLLQQTIDIFQRLVLSLTGADGKSQTYNSSGQLRTRLTNNDIVVEKIQN